MSACSVCDPTLTHTAKQCSTLQHTLQHTPQHVSVSYVAVCVAVYVIYVAVCVAVYVVVCCIVLLSVSVHLEACGANHDFWSHTETYFWLRKDNDFWSHAENNFKISDHIQKIHFVCDENSCDQKWFFTRIHICINAGVHIYIYYDAWHICMYMCVCMYMYIDVNKYEYLYEGVHIAACVYIYNVTNIHTYTIV